MIASRAAISANLETSKKGGYREYIESDLIEDVTTIFLTTIIDIKLCINKAVTEALP